MVADKRPLYNKIAQPIFPVGNKRKPYLSFNILFNILLYYEFICWDFLGTFKRITTCRLGMRIEYVLYVKTELKYHLGSNEKAQNRIPRWTQRGLYTSYFNIRNDNVLLLIPCPLQVPTPLEAMYGLCTALVSYYNCQYINIKKMKNITATIISYRCNCARSVTHLLFQLL